MSFFAELKRRNVIRVGIAYLVSAWLVIEAAAVLLEIFKAPDWVAQTLVVVLAIGFLVALAFSWAFELTPDGLRRDDGGEGGAGSARKLDVLTIIAVILLVGVTLWDRSTTPIQVVETAPPVAPPSAPASDAVPVIAVLPFQATGSDDGGFLAAGLHDDLLTRLAQLESFRVISRTSMMEYAERTQNMREIGTELGAGFILEGGVQAQGDRVRINVQLIDAAKDEHIWAEIYDRELTATDLFEVQTELAIAIAEQMHVTLAESDLAIVAGVPTGNTEAYQAYLRGLELVHGPESGLDHARETVEAFEEAVRLDPNFAAAWAQLSGSRTWFARLSRDDSLLDSALVALERARELQPDLFDAELAWASYLYYGRSEYQQALDVIQALGAQRTLTSEAMQMEGLLLRRLGHFLDAYRAMLAATRVEPRDIWLRIDLIEIAIVTGMCNEAAREVGVLLDDQPENRDVSARVALYELECTGDAARAGAVLQDLETDSGWQVGMARHAALASRDFERLLEIAEIPFSYREAIAVAARRLYRAEALRFLGREDEVTEELEAVTATLEILAADAVSDSGDYAWTAAWYHAFLGDAEQVAHWIEEDRRRFWVETKGDILGASLSHMRYAEMFTMAGLHDEAIEELRVMLEEPGGHSFTHTELRPSLDPLRDEPGYAELQERYGDPE